MNDEQDNELGTETTGEEIEAVEIETTEPVGEEVATQIKFGLEGLDTQKIETDLEDLDWVLSCLDGKAGKAKQSLTEEEEQILCSRCSGDEAVGPVLEICSNARKAART